MKPGHDLDHMADVLVEAFYARDDETVAKRHDISARSIKRYRKRLASGDAELTRRVTEKRKGIDDRNRERLTSLLVEAVEKAIELVRKADSPEHLHDVVGAMKIASELLLEGDILNGRSSNHRPHSTPPTSPTDPGDRTAGEGATVHPIGRKASG